MNSSFKRLAQIIGALSISLSANAQVSTFITGIHSPDIVAAGYPRPCYFIKANGTYYAINKTATHYSELRQIALTAYVMKVPVVIYFNGNFCAGIAEVDAISLA
jgi:hypothetical protein